MSLQDIGSAESSVTTSEQATSLTSQAYERLRADIIAGILKPGQKLKIENLRKLYQTGASPIREALSLLTSDRLVDRLDQRGFRVSVVSRSEFDELLRTRCWLEERALRESISRGESEWEEQVVLSHYHLTRIPRSPESDNSVASDTWEARHKHFHMMLISGCGSSILVRMCEQLYDQNIRYRQIAGELAYPKRNIQDEHDAIAQSALNRDADAAVEALISHYDRTGAFLRENL